MSDVRTMAIRDWRRFSVSSFNLFLTFIAPSPGFQQAKVKGIGTNIAQTIETDGQDIVIHNVRITFSEQELLTNNCAYPVRNDDNLVDLMDHSVSFNDANGNTQNYKVINYYPDNTTGMITCECTYLKTT